MSAPAHPSLVVGNWKMHGVTADLAEIGSIARDLSGWPASAEVVICPPATLLAIASRALDGTGIVTGGQDCSAEHEGAHTGGVPPPHEYLPADEAVSRPRSRRRPT